MRRLAPIFALALLACAPPRLPASEGGSPDEAGEDTTGEDTTGTTSSSSSTDTGPSSFVPEYDVPPWPECDVFAQDCPAGEKCVPFASTGMYWDTYGCVPVLGEVPPGGTCTWDGLGEGTDDCDASSYCWTSLETEGEQIGHCAPMCTGSFDDPMCPPGSLCVLGGDGGLALCIQSCDPIMQDCPGDLACYWVGNGFQCFPPSAEGGDGEPCRSQTGCAGGSLCAGADELPSCAEWACCAPYCELEAPDPCPELLAGSSCVAFFSVGTAPPGLEHVGYCGLP